MGIPTRDLTGHVFGRLTVLEMDSRGHRGLARWRCLCSCGSTKTVLANNLIHGGTVSCGCKKAEVMRTAATVKHGHSWRGGGTPEFFCWSSMIARCSNQSHKQWRHYGGRGIRVCERWQASFSSFLEDMGPRPGPGFSLDRIDNERGYEPGNCRWTTAKVQGRNKRRVILCETAAVLIRHMSRRGSRRADVAWAFGVSPEAITLINKGRSWDGAIEHLGGLP